MIDGIPFTTLQPRASCENCRWSHGPSPLTEERARAHAQHRGHHVQVVTEQIQFITPTREVPGERQPSAG